MSDEILQRMAELMTPIDTSIQLTDDHNDLLMLACAMMQRTNEIFERVLGVEGRKHMYRDLV